MEKLRIILPAVEQNSLLEFAVVERESHMMVPMHCLLGTAVGVDNSGKASFRNHLRIPAAADNGIIKLFQQIDAFIPFLYILL